MAGKKLTDVSASTDFDSIFLNIDGTVKQISKAELKTILGVVSYVLPTASSSTLGGVKVGTSTTNDTVEVHIKSDGTLVVPKYPTELTYTLPIANAGTLGGVKPVAKTTAMTQSIGVDENGRLFTSPTTGGSGGGSSIDLDTSLTVSGAAADAKSTGDRLESLETALSSYITSVASLVGGDA